MKNLFAFLLFILLCTNCSINNIASSNKPTQELKENVDTVLNDWHKAAAEAHYENYFNRLDSSAVFIGTDASENWTKKQFSDFSKPYFDKGKAWNFKSIERNIYISSSKDLVWFDELLNTWMGVCRGSGVLVKKGKEWKIKHYVLSITIPNDDVQKVIKAKQKNDAIFLKKFN